MLIYSYTYFSKSKKQRRMSRIRMYFSLFIVAVGAAMSQLGGTNAYFFDEGKIDNITFAAGVWIPTVTMTVDPDEPDGLHSVYSESPCVRFDVDIDDTTIHYVFQTDDDESSGMVDPGTCVYPPEGASQLEVYAVNDKNDNWVSESLTESFVVHTVSEGDIVINELMWMGAFGDKRDEWIELRNMTDREIDLSGFRIEGAGQGGGGHIQIPRGYSIEAGGYFLITREKWNKTAIGLDSDLDKDEGYTHVSGMGLQNGGEKLVLQDAEKNAIDVAWKNNKMWPDGFDGLFLHLSMERDLKPGDGTKKSSWHTCIDKKCNDKTYWHKEGLNFGTPGKKNSEKFSFDWHVGDDGFEKEITKYMRGKEGVINDILEECDEESKKEEECEQKNNKKNELLKNEDRGELNEVGKARREDLDEGVVEFVNDEEVGKEEIANEQDMDYDSDEEAD